MALSKDELASWIFNSGGLGTCVRKSMEKYLPDMMRATTSSGERIGDTSLVGGPGGHSIGFVEHAPVPQERKLRSANAGLERDLGLKLGDLGLEEAAPVREHEVEPPVLEVPRDEEFAEAG